MDVVARVVGCGREIDDEEEGYCLTAHLGEAGEERARESPRWNESGAWGRSSSTLGASRQG